MAKSEFNKSQGAGVEKKYQLVAIPVGILFAFVSFVPFVFVPFRQGRGIDEVFEAAKFITFCWLVLGLVAVLVGRFYFKRKNPELFVDSPMQDKVMLLMVESVRAAPFMSVILWVLFDFINSHSG